MQNDNLQFTVGPPKTPGEYVVQLFNEKIVWGYYNGMSIYPGIGKQDFNELTIREQKLRPVYFHINIIFHLKTN